MFEGDHQIKVPKTHEVVAERLRREIVSGRLTVGDRLPSEEELTATFGIARTTLREALRVLESQGLIEIRRGRGGGPIVTSPDLKSVAHSLAMALQIAGVTYADLDEASQLLEPQAAGRLAKVRTADDLAALRSIITAATEATDTDDAQRFAVAVIDFHEAIMDRSGNVTLATLSRILHELMTEYYRTGAILADRSTRRRAIRSYQKLVGFIEDRNAAAAEDHWRRQLRYKMSNHEPSERFDMFRPMISSRPSPSP